MALNNKIQKMGFQKYLASAVLLLLFYATAHSQTSELVTLGYQKLEARELDEAIKHFSQALNTNPTDTSALSGIIRAHLLAENLKDAQKVIDNAIQHHPNNPEFHIRRGILNNLRGQPRKAITDFDTAIGLSNGTNNIQILINRGIAYIQDERYDDAINDFTEVLNINPRYAPALNQRAFSYYKLGNFNESINDYNKIIDLNPENAMNYYNRGMAYLRSGNKAKACTDFHQSCRRGNRNACKMIMSECSSSKN
jgi:tetratricopeptide (TPR) repeat protein